MFYCFNITVFHRSPYSNSSNLYFTSTNDSDFYSFSNRNSIFDSRPSEKKFELNVDIKKVICLEDRRTTVMIKNIPNKFNRDMLLNIIDKNFKGAYDIFILPTDVNRYKNFGYSFINFTCSYYIPNFYYLFNGKKWSNTNSQKMCEITYSKIQGRNNLLQHYSNKIIFRNDEAKKYNIYGFRRPLWTKPKNLKYERNENNDLILSFSLPTGSYATIFL